MEYGTPLYPSINKVHPYNNNIHALISQYFNNPIMTKIHNNNNESHYYTQINSQLLNKHRYIIAIIPKDSYNNGKKIYLQNLKWFSLQTRSINTNYNIPKISYPKSSILDKYIIKSHNITDNITSYSTENTLNIDIHLLHTTNNKYEYPMEATLTNAIETYQTLINII